MADSINYSQAQKLFKEIYGTDFLKACPVERQLYDTFTFERGEAPGAAFVQAVRMTEEQGFTFRRGNTDITSDMRDPVALKVEQARITGDILEFRSRVDVPTFVQALDNKRAFRDMVGLRQEAMRDSVMKHQEWTLLCGGRPLGEISAIAAGSIATRKILTITAATWAGGFWAGSENMPLDIYDSTSATRAPGAVSRMVTVNGTYKVISYDLDAKTLEVEAPAAGDWVPVGVGDCLWRATSYLNESLGLLELTNTNTGVVNNIDASAYGLWRGVRDTAGGALSVDRVIKMAAKVATRSSARTKLTFRCSPLQHTVFNAELSGLRRYDGSYERKAKQGFMSIELYTPNGLIEILPHSFMPDGVTHLSDDSQVTRRGPSDIDFNMPGMGEQMYLLVPNRNQIEYRAYSYQGLLNMAPARSGIFTGLTVPA